MIQYVFGFFFRPRYQWNAVKRLEIDKVKPLVPYLLVMPALPAIAFFLGTTQTGWQFGGRLIKITLASALPLSIMFYLTLLASTVAMGIVIHWMATTYGAVSNPAKGILTATFTATPIFIAGLAGAYPVFWADILLLTAAVTYSLYLLYFGIKIMMGIQEERVFLFASSVIAAAMVLVIVIMGGTTIIWEYIAKPIFIE